MNEPQPAAEQYRLFDGVIALAGGLLWLERSRTIVAADAHLGYEDVIGGALPLWSTTETMQSLLLAARRLSAREIILLGDVIHATRMSDGAAATVRNTLAMLRKERTLTLVAGNHEGRTRGFDVLGDTEEAVERDGWTLLHGDEPMRAPRCIIGHLHPSLSLGAGTYVPAFLAASHLVVVPALTPYSNGLNVLSSECTAALRKFGETRAFTVVATTQDRVYPFGSLHGLRRITAVGYNTGNDGRTKNRRRARIV